MEQYYPDWNIFGVPDNQHDAFRRRLNRILVQGRQKVNIRKQKSFGKAILSHVKGIDVEFSNEPQQKGTYGQVAHGTYNGEQVVVKRLLQSNEASTFILEAIIQIILHNYTEAEDCAMRVPIVYAFGRCKFPRIVTRFGSVGTETGTETISAMGLVMQEIDGNLISTYNRVTLETHLTTVIDGLEQLQTDLSFVHRDLHADNIIIRDNTPYIIDFGMACIGTPRKIVQNYFVFTTGCTNKSHDVCCLIVNLATYWNKKKLQPIAKKICDAYKKEVTESPSKEFDKNKTFYFKGHHWKDDIFHWFYVTLLEGIQLDKYVPEKLLRNKIVCRLRF